MTFTLDPLLFDTPVIPQIIDRICESDPEISIHFQLHQQTETQFYSSLTQEQRKKYRVFEDAFIDYMNDYIHAAYYAGLGVRSLLLDALGVSDTPGSQPEPGSQVRS